MKNIKKVFQLVMCFALCWIYSYMLVKPISEWLKSGTSISDGYYIWLQLLLPVVIAIIITILGVHPKKKQTRFGKAKLWFKSNMIIVSYALLMILLCLNSCADQPNWNCEDMISIINIEWTITGVSMGALIAWNLLVLDPISKLRPNITPATKQYEVPSVVARKEGYIALVESGFGVLTYFICSFVLVVSATIIVYGFEKELSKVSSTITTISFYGCITAAGMMLGTILSFFLEAKKTMLKGFNISSEEITTANMVEKKFDAINKVQAVLDKNGVGEEEKAVILQTMLDELNKPMEDQ